ncbi:hypothetical protein PanWU01x14_147830 [Parasponia andersonii]|uniref:Uncharacterized protein n=1 Tax=Parasponia andersonii TaxID=3476 RepID=A0A2P5CJG5_PARAD|nr:hypothetical protein PanWU01x14_147830 [Parasponia andersonii]
MSKNQEKSTNKEVQQQAVLNLQMQALIGEMRQKIRAELEQIYGRLDKEHRREVEEVDEDEGKGVEEKYDRMSVGSHRRYGMDREARNRVDNSLRNIKMRIFTFQGKKRSQSVSRVGKEYGVSLRLSQLF